MARILIVEDEALIAEILAVYIEDLGHHVIGPASTVDEALSMINKTPPEFAILDCLLGREESTPVAKALSKSGLRFAFATGRGAAGLPEEFKNAPMITKPYAFENVQRVLEVLIS